MRTAPEFLVEPLPDRAPISERWLRVVPAIEGESLTSRLGRQSRLWGVPLSSLLRDFLTSDCKGIPDLDITPPVDLIAQVAARFGEPTGEIEKGTFRQILRHLMPPECLAKISLQKWKAGHIPWILPSGWQEVSSWATWRSGGIPYCPICVLEGGLSHSPLAHRLAFHVACERHRVSLLDRCPTCESRTSPAFVVLRPDEAEGIVGIRCDLCPSMLPTRAPIIEKANTGILTLQRSLSSGLSTGTVAVPQLGQFPTVQYLGGLRFALSVVVWLREQGVSLPPARSGKVPHYTVRSSGVKGGPFETQPLSERIHRMRDAAWVLTAPLDRWALLHQLCAWPNNLPKSWRHPWEGLTMKGEEIRKSHGERKKAQQPEIRDIHKVRAFFDLVEELGIHPVRVQGMLGNISSSRYNRWRNQPTTQFPLDCYRRMEAFLQLWDRLLAFFITPITAHEWLMRPNKHAIFNGNAPIDAFAEDGTIHRFEAAVAMFGYADAHGHQERPCIP